MEQICMLHDIELILNKTFIHTSYPGLYLGLFETH